MAASKKKVKNTKRSNKKTSSTNQNQIPKTPENTQGLEKADLVDDFMFNAADYIYRRKKLFISLGIAIALIIISAYGTISFFKYRDNLRHEALFQIEKLMNDSSLSQAQHFKKGIPLLNKFIEENPDTKQYHLALFYRSGLYFRQKQFHKAEKDLRVLTASLNKDSELFILASVYLSNVLQDQQKIDQAIEVLEVAKTKKMTDIILMELSEVYLNSLQKEKAKHTLEILLKDYPQSVYNRRAKQLLKTL